MASSRIPQLPRMLSLLLAVLLVGVLFRIRILTPGVLRHLADPLHVLSSSPTLVYVVVVGGFLGLLGATIVGLLLRRIWGVYCAYALVPVSTILHGVALVPVLADLLPTIPSRVAGVFALNLLFLLGVVFLHVEYRKGNASGRQAGSAA